MNRRWTWLPVTGAVGIVATAAVLTFGLAPGRPVPGPPPATEPVQVVPNSPIAVPAEPDSTGLAQSFADLRLPGVAGVVIAAAGDHSAVPVTLGEWSGGPAWSTIKVPLTIAGLRQQGSDVVTAEMTAAITRSDNAAAESIWAGLGDPPVAAGQVQEVLREAGDPTVVESRTVRPEFSAFGQTIWSLADQARFLASAVCDPRDEPILNLMGQVDPAQRWGLGTIAGSRIKGGWGPSPTGRYLVRQIGVLPTPRGAAVVAMAIEPESGQFADGTAALTALAGWLQRHRDVLPSGGCGT